MDVAIIETSGLGDRSYLVHDDREALIVDPQRDIDRVLEAAERAGVTITAVAETHIHNDYVTGGRALADAPWPTDLLTDIASFQAHDADWRPSGVVPASRVATSWRPGVCPRQKSRVLSRYWSFHSTHGGGNSPTR